MRLFFVIVALMGVTRAQFLSDDDDDSPCDRDERRRASESHARCIEQVQARQRVAQAAAGRGGLVHPQVAHLAALCQRLEEQVERCSEHLGRCMTAADLRVVKDAQIDAFAKYLDQQRLGHFYRECEIVLEYKRSGRRPYKATEKCTLDEVGEVLRRREDCISRERLTMSSQMSGLRRSERARRNQIICNFVDMTMNQCTREMSECYDSDTFDKMRQNSYEALQGILGKLDVGFSLEDDCENQLATPSPLPPLRLTNAANGRADGGKAVLLSAVASWALILLLR